MFCSRRAEAEYAEPSRSFHLSLSLSLSPAPGSTTWIGSAVIFMFLTISVIDMSPTTMLDHYWELCMMEPTRLIEKGETSGCLFGRSHSAGFSRLPIVPD